MRRQAVTRSFLLHLVHSYDFVKGMIQHDMHDFVFSFVLGCLGDGYTYTWSIHILIQILNLSRCPFWTVLMSS
jgi:hypothetical protein